MKRMHVLSTWLAANNQLSTWFQKCVTIEYSWLFDDLIPKGHGLKHDDVYEFVRLAEDEHIIIPMLANKVRHSVIYQVVLNKDTSKVKVFVADIFFHCFNSPEYRQAIEWLAQLSKTGRTEMDDCPLHEYASAPDFPVSRGDKAQRIFLNELSQLGIVQLLGGEEFDEEILVTYGVVQEACERVLRALEKFSLLDETVSYLRRLRKLPGIATAQVCMDVPKKVQRPPPTKSVFKEYVLWRENRKFESPDPPRFRPVHPPKEKKAPPLKNPTPEDFIRLLNATSAIDLVRPFLRAIHRVGNQVTGLQAIQLLSEVYHWSEDQSNFLRECLHACLEFFFLELVRLEDGRMGYKVPESALEITGIVPPVKRKVFLAPRNETPPRIDIPTKKEPLFQPQPPAEPIQGPALPSPKPDVDLDQLAEVLLEGTPPKPPKPRRPRLRVQQARLKFPSLNGDSIEIRRMTTTMTSQLEALLLDLRARFG